MTQKQLSAVLEIAILGALVLIMTAFFWDTLDLPTSRREPLGSAAIPQAVCLIVALFCTILIGRAVSVFCAVRREQAGKASRRDPASGQDTGYRRRYDFAGASLLAAVAYVALLQTRWISAEVLTVIFLAGVILMLNRFRPGAVLPALLVALIVGLGSTYVFTELFYVDLP